MTKRRLALCSREPLATSVFLSLILVFFLALPSNAVRAEPGSSGAGTAVGEAERVDPGDMNTGALLLQGETPALPLTVVPKPEASPLASLKAPDMNRQIAMLALVLALLSGLTFILWRYHRRDYASPRRIGRRI